MPKWKRACPKEQVYQHILDPKDAETVCRIARLMGEAVQAALSLYYNKNVNYLHHQDEQVECEAAFAATHPRLRDLTLCALPMMQPCIDSPDDVLLAVYGIGSNAVRLYRQFMAIRDRYPHYDFDADYMGVFGYQGLCDEVRNAIVGPLWGQVSAEVD